MCNIIPFLSFPFESLVNATPASEKLQEGYTDRRDLEEKSGEAEGEKNPRPME